MPIVATARYSPPEYLFRLLQPGSDAWHALDVYQLGGLLHDLIMREPLFEQVFQSAKDNRYRFAWTVATVEPSLEADDVDRDLLALARRALDKDWRRRSALKLEDFLDDTAVRQKRSLGMLGLRPQTPIEVKPSVAEIRNRLETLGEQTHREVTERLRNNGVLAKHDVEWLDDQTCQATFSWMTQPTDGEAVSLRIQIRYVSAATGSSALPSVSLTFEGQAHGVDLPAVPWEDGASRVIAEGAMQVLGELAERFMSANRAGG